MNKNKKMACKVMRKSILVLTIICTTFLAGCAGEMSDSKNLTRIRQEASRENNPLEVKSTSDLYNTNKEKVFDDNVEQNTADLPTFSVEKGTGRVVNANPEQLSRGEKTEGTVTLNFENADLREVVKFIMTDLLKLNYIIAANVQGKVTLQTSNPISKEDLLPTLETLLKLNGSIMFQDGDLIRVLPQAEAAGKIVPKVGRLTKLKAGYGIRVIPLKYISATQAQKSLEPFLPAGSLLQVDAARNILTVAGTNQELANIQQTIDTFDVDWLKGMSIGLYRLQNVGIDEIMPELEGLFGEGADSQFAGLFKFIPMERNNSIMVITTQAKYLSDAERWLGRLDQTGNSDTERFYVYRVQNGRAGDLEGVLSGIFGDSSSSSNKSSNRDKQVAPGSVGGTTSSNKTGNRTNTNVQNRSNTTNKNVANNKSGSNSSSGTNKNSSNKNNSSRNASSSSEVTASIVADEVNNSLIIKATPANYDSVMQALRQIDVPKLQVLLDVVIAEISLKDNLQYGLKFKLDSGADAPKSSTINTGNVGFNYSLVSGKIAAEVNLLAEKNMAQFLSTPSLMVLDNETATMDVGSQISVAGDSYLDSNGNPISSNSYLSTGVSLSVTPRVNAGGVIVLDITQSVSRADRTSTGSSNNPDIFNRDITSSISALDGQTVVLGGLIQQDNSSSRAGVPYLSDIPLIGPLFRGTTRDSNRTELVVLITPHVSRDQGQSLEITKEFMSKMRTLEIFNNKEVINKK